ncbi:hypothetical protein ACQWHU_24855, partial [Salmonella enterica subsp. enterica serovar Infantis]
RSAQRGGNCGAMVADFTMLYQATLAGVTVIYRLLEGLYVFICMFIKMSLHRGQRSGFAAGC